MMCSLSELPCDILHHVTKLLVEYHPEDSINIRRVNREFNYQIDCFIKSYETELFTMLSACRISVLSPNVRLKYTLRYLQSKKVDGVTEEHINKPVVTMKLCKHDMVFLVLLVFIILF